MRLFAFAFLLLSATAHAEVCGRVFAFLVGMPPPLPVKELKFDPARLPETIAVGDGVSLSRAQFVALARAEASGHYQVELVRKTIDGVPRLVVLMGEAHVKGKTAAALGRAVLNEFPVRGLEGVELKKNWGGRALAFTLELLERIARFFRFNGGSTIDLGNKGATRKFHLEDGHVPDLKEQVASVYVPGLLVTCAAAVCVSAYASSGLPAGQTLREVMSIAIAGIGLHAVAGKLLGPFVARDAGLQYVLNPMRGLSPARSETMARNIDGLLGKNREIDTILVVVGRAHVPEIRGDLEKVFRFSGGGLPEVPTEVP